MRCRFHNARIVHTEFYEGAEADEADAPLNIVTFEEADGRTTLTILMQCNSKALRDTIIETGMEGGLQDALDLTEEVAISLR